MMVKKNMMMTMTMTTTVTVMIMMMMVMMTIITIMAARVITFHRVQTMRSRVHLS